MRFQYRTKTRTSDFSGKPHAYDVVDGAGLRFYIDDFPAGAIQLRDALRLVVGIEFTRRRDAGETVSGGE